MNETLIKALKLIVTQSHEFDKKKVYYFSDVICFLVFDWLEGLHIQLKPVLLGWLASILKDDDVLIYEPIREEQQPQLPKSKFLTLEQFLESRERISFEEYEDQYGKWEWDKQDVPFGFIYADCNVIGVGKGVFVHGSETHHSLQELESRVYYEQYYENHDFQKLWDEVTATIKDTGFYPEFDLYKEQFIKLFNYGIDG